MLMQYLEIPILDKMNHEVVNFEISYFKVFNPMERHENVNELSICVVYRYWRVFYFLDIPFSQLEQT
jgi:hypothetical protein